MTAHAQAAPEIEYLLTQVRGVEAVQVNEGDFGEIRAIKVLIDKNQSVRRMTRDIESALMSGLGISLNHRAINVVHGNGLALDNTVSNTQSSIPAERPLSATLDELQPAYSLPNFELESSHPSLAAQVERVRLASVRLKSDGELYCEVTVELERSGQRYSGQAQDADTPRGRLHAAGRAALEAFARTLDDEVALLLDGVHELAISDDPAILATVGMRRDRDRKEFQGIALVEGEPLEAAVRAVLDALNRFWDTEEHVSVTQTRERTRIGAET